MIIEHLLTLDGLSSSEVYNLIEESLKVKTKWTELVSKNSLKGKVVLLYFELPSTRTRLSFEVAALRLGCGTIYLKEEDLQLTRGESISDTARVLSSMGDLIVARVKDHKRLVELAEHSRVPVINALTNMHHPTQALTDLVTILEVKGKLRGVELAYIGDGFNNVCHSLLIACSKVGINIRIATPRGYEPSEDVVKRAIEYSKESGSKIIILNDPVKAVKGADVVYTDVFVSMGRESEKERRLRDFSGWQVNKELIKYAKEDYVFMHCLPAHRGEEVTSEVIDDKKHSVVWTQAKNKLYVAATLLLRYLA